MKKNDDDDIALEYCTRLLLLWEKTRKKNYQFSLFFVLNNSFFYLFA